MRVEVGYEGICMTTLYPGSIASELLECIHDAEAAEGMKVFYEAKEISADSLVRSVVYAIEQPAEVSINEITLRPTQQKLLT